MFTCGAQGGSSRLVLPARPREMFRVMSAVWTVVTVCLLAALTPVARAVQVTVVCADLVGAGGVGIRVWPTLKASPERHAKTLRFRLIQINWEAERLLEGDWVGVFQDDPRPPHLRPPPTPMPPTSNLDWRAPQPLFWDTPYATLGSITTNYSQPRTELSVLARGGCVGPYVGFVRNGVCVASQCLASHPTWLFDHRAVLGRRSLRSLVLPGTHNAGSYSLTDDNAVMASWVMCQDEDVISQLLYGNRYLDLRVAYYPDTPELLWINHALVRLRPLKEVLDDVRGFLALSPDPVIIDIHRTPVGFNLPESLELLLSLMNTTLGSHFVLNRHGPHVTLDNLWQMGKRVVFTFIDPTVSDHTPWVWPPVPQAWANAQLLDDLRNFLDAEMNKRFESPRLWAAMAHLTPSLWDLLFRSHVGVRGMADRSNFHITRWLRQRWGHMANIVASDFFRSNDIINVAIRTNLALSMCRPSGPSRHPYTLRWTTELTLRNGSPSTTTTTIPPFVRRMYTSGTLWTTTGVRQIHYPFTPVDANISMVFTAIPNRVPSLAPGVTYQESTDTWRQIFHYPADGSPKPPEETASRPYSHPRGYVTSSPVASEPSPRANDEIILGEWDNVDAHDFLDDVFVARVKDNVSANATNAPRLLGKINHDLNFSSQEDLTHSTFWRSKSDVTEPPLTHNLGNTDANYDTFNDTNSMTHTRNTTQDRDKGAILTHEPLYPTITSSLEDELLPSNIQHNTDSSLLVRNDTLDGYSMSSISKNTHINPQSTMASSTQDSYSSKTHENSFLDLESNATEDGSHLLAIDDVTSTGHSSIVPEDVLMTSQSVSIPLGQEGGGVTQEGRHSDGSVSDTESINDLNTSGILVLPHHLILEDSTKQSQALQHTTRQVGSLTGVPKVIAQTPIVTTMTVQPDLTMQPSALTFIIQSDSSVARIQPSTSTVRYQTYDATLTPQRGMSDLEVTKSSSNVT